MSSDSHKKEKQEKHDPNEQHGMPNAEAGAHEGKKSKKKLILIGAVIALVLVIAGTAVFFFVLKGKKPAGEAQQGAAVDNKEEGKEEKSKEKDKKGEAGAAAEKEKPSEKTFYPSIFFTERLTIPLAMPVREKQEKPRTLARIMEEEERLKESRKFLIVKLAFEFKDEKEKKDFEKIFPAVLEQISQGVSQKNKDELVKFSGKIKLKLELARIADRVSNGRIKPRNIYFTDFTIQ